MPDLVGLDAAVAALREMLDTEIPKVGVMVNGAITSLGTVTNTAIQNAENSARRVVKDVFDRMDGLAKRFSLPIQITISKPGETE